MKVLIDIPQEVLENPHNYCCYTLANQIKGNYTPISENATNGDMIKALFPNQTIGCAIPITDRNGAKFYRTTINGVTDFTADWWNTPYKRGNENG